MDETNEIQVEHANPAQPTAVAQPVTIAAPVQPTAVAQPIDTGAQHTAQKDDATIGAAVFERVQPALGSSDIVLDHITMRFGRKTVLDDISLTLAGGELVALVGGSGSGKSTLANIIIGELEPTAGSVRFEGTCGFVPQKNLVHENLRVKQQLSFYASAVKRLPFRMRRKRVRSVIEQLGLSQVQRSVIRRCSGGETRRVSVGCELLANPDVLFLDEPTSGLDPGDSGDVIDLLRTLVAENEMSVVVISHDYENIELFDKIVFLAGGKICYYGTPKKLYEYFGSTSSRRIYNLLRDDPSGFIARFAEWQVAHPGMVGGIR